MRIGFLGVGGMSTPMINNLLTDGHQVSIWNRTAAKCEALSDSGAVVVQTPAEACERSGIVMSCLAGDPSVDAVLSDGAVVDKLGEGGIHVAMSTVSAQCTTTHLEAHKNRGVTLIAAPIVGRPDAVAARMQSYLIAGDRDAKAKVTPILDALGAKVFDFGDEPATASIAKIAFNFLIASAIESMAEAFTVIEKSGIDKQSFYELVTGTAFGCRIYEGYGKLIHERTFDSPLFSLALGLKDVSLAQEAMHQAGVAAPFAQLLVDRYSQAVDDGLGETDWTGITETVRKESGL
ncbi:MAG: NAD(P)-dependent oxidoreductase [Pseudomonadota bacterium]